MALEDLLNHFKTIYRTSPGWFKRSVGQMYAWLPRRFRYGGAFVRTRRFLDESQGWSAERHREYQWQQMKLLLRHAYENVAYYRRVMDEIGLTPEDVQSPEHWQHLPFLTKDIVRENKEELVAANMRNRKLDANTGGSTARPMEFYLERGRTQSMERAFMFRQWQWVGFRPDTRMAVIGGRTVKEDLYHYDPVDKQLFINAYNISDENGPALLKKLRQFKPLYIHGYPSNQTALASYMKRHGEPPIESVRLLLCGSENVYPAQKAFLQDVHQARVYAWYGHGESCVLAGYCEKSDLYHVYSEYGYAELIDTDGNVLPWTQGQQGEIVGTSFNNHTMPFIRYRTGDIGVAGPAECPCGRSYKLLANVQGRKQEYVVTSDGRLIALTGVVFGQHWHAFARIHKLQIEQRQRGEVVIHIVKAPGYSEADENEIREKINTCVRSGLKVVFDYVADIPRTKSGKHMFVKQSLPLEGTWSGDAHLAGPDPSGP